MKNERLLDAFGQIEGEFIEEADPDKKRNAKKKPQKNIWVMWGATAACVVLIAGIYVPQLIADMGATKGAEVESPNDTLEPGDGPANLVVNEIAYFISPHLVVCDELPDGYAQAGETNVGGFEGCPYYINPNVPEWVYVYHEVTTNGEVDSSGTLIRTEPHYAYVRYVDERLRGKDLVSYNGEYYISMWSAEYYGDTPDVSKEYYDSMESTYGIRLEGDAPNGFDSAGVTEFCGFDTIPRGVLSSNQGSYEVFVSENEPNILLVATEWYTAATDEDGETKHVGFNVYVKYDCPLN